MNKKILQFTSLFLLPVFIMAFTVNNNSCNSSNPSTIKEETGIRFVDPSWSKVLEEAKKQDKLIFLDAYTTWCGPCKLLKSKTFTDEKAGKFFNDNFINVAFDMEAGDGIKLAEKYNVNAYPTLLILDKNGKIVTYTIGFINAKELIRFGESGLAKK
jgi:thioredoxin 1